MLLSKRQKHTLNKTSTGHHIIAGHIFPPLALLNITIAVTESNLP